MEKDDRNEIIWLLRGSALGLTIRGCPCTKDVTIIVIPTGVGQ